jgi:uridine kinase
MMLGVSDPAAAPAVPVILLGGASGSGKSYLAQHYGRPALQLDNFYRNIAEDQSDPMPRTAYGEIDWDDPGTWNCEAAVASVKQLLGTGETSVPKYSIEQSTSFGRIRVRLQAGGQVVAEGVFARTALAALRAAGVPVTAYYVDSPRLVTTLLRFARDVREHRKPIPFLIKRGFALYRADPAFRRAHLEAGFVPVPKRELKRLLAAGKAG